MHVKTLPSATPHTTSTNGDGIMATRGGGIGGKGGGGWAVIMNGARMAE